MFWKTRTFRGEVDFHMLQSCLEQDQLKIGKQKGDYDTPTCEFDINDVKGGNHENMGAAF